VFQVGAANGTKPAMRALTMAGLFLNVPYFLLARTARGLRAQAYARMLGDVTFITLGLYISGGLAAAPYLGVYTIVPVYAAIVFSTRACVMATIAGTLGYLLIALLQSGGWLPMTRPAMPDAWTIAGFNLLIVNIVGALAALLSEA